MAFFGSKSIQGDQVARGFASVLLARRARQEQLAGRLKLLAEQERLRRERAEENRQAALEKEKSVTSKKTVKEKVDKRLSQLRNIEVAIGRKNIQTNFGREPARERMMYDPIGRKFIRIPEPAQGISRERIANIGLGTQSQQFNAVNRFRETRGAELIDNSEEIRRRQMIREKGTEWRERDSKLLNEEYKGKGDTQRAYIRNKIQGARARRNKDEQSYWEDKLRQISQTPQDHFISGVPEYKKGSISLEEEFPQYKEQIANARKEGYSDDEIREQLNAIRR